jgi:hypothetical protein
LGEYEEGGRCMSEKYQHIVIKKNGKVVESYIRKIEVVQEVEKEKSATLPKEPRKNK